MSTAVQLAGRLTWRTLHPHLRERFIESPRPVPLRRLYYRAVDGWQSPILCLPPSAGGAGEPVAVLHGLGLGPDSFRYGQAPTLAQRLTEAGFAVYLVSHRGDREAIPPRGAGSAGDFDAIVERDLPAALHAIEGDQAYPRVHLVGFGLGGQLAMVLGARDPRVATVSAVGAPVRFERPRSRLRLATRAASLLPAGWQLPVRLMSRAGAPFMEGPGPVASTVAGERLRGVMAYATEDVRLDLLEQLMDWMDHGSLVSQGGVRDLVEEFAGSRAPLLAIAGGPDPADGVRAAVRRWGTEARFLSAEAQAPLDLLLGSQADPQVFQPLVGWLAQRRRLAWEDRGQADEALAVG